MKSGSQPGDSENFPQKYEDLSFDGWIYLHQTEPERFDQYRRKLLNDLVKSAPQRSRARLKGLIFQMEAEGRRSRSQWAYNIRLASLMMNSLGELNQHLNQLAANKSNSVGSRQAAIKSAKILPFNRVTPVGADQ